MSLSRPHRAWLIGSTLAVALLVVACAGEDALDPTPDDTADEDAAGSITVGSANFPESVMLAHMYALALEDLGMEVTTRTNIGAREVYFPALQQGELDLLPEYTGALAAFLADEDVEVTETTDLVGELRSRLEPEVQVLEPSDTQNANGWTVTQDTAQEYGLARRTSCRSSARTP